MVPKCVETNFLQEFFYGIDKLNLLVTFNGFSLDFTLGYFWLQVFANFGYFWLIYL